MFTIHSVVVVGEADRPVVEAFCRAFTQDGAHELFADIFVRRRARRLEGATVAAFAVLGGVREVRSVRRLPAAAGAGGSPR